MKYRKKPVVIEAIQWFPGIKIEGVQEKPGKPGLCGVFGTINTLEGKMHVTSGDWIIKGMKGELYPCKPDIFEATYEKVL